MAGPHGRVRRLAAHLGSTSPSPAPTTAPSDPHAAINLRKLASTTEQVVVRDAGYFPVLARWPDDGGDRLVVAYRGGAGHIGIGGRISPRC
jgi:hypothetical protein